MNCLIALFVALVMFVPAQAALIIDDSSLGPATVVRDTDTGLEWARLPVTANLSVREVLSRMMPDGQLEEFRYSNPDEVLRGLIQGVYRSCPQNSVSCNYFEMRSMIDLFGGNREGFWAPYSVIDIQDTDPAFITFNIISFELFTEPEFSYYLDSGPTSLADLRFEFGHFIVRQTPALPEPATATLLAIGIIALLGRYKRWS